jgi:RHS repeat-associated protein
MSGEIARVVKQGVEDVLKPALKDAGKALERATTSVAHGGEKVAENAERAEADISTQFARDARGEAGAAKAAEPHAGSGPGESPSLGNSRRGGQASNGNRRTTTSRDPVDVVSGQMITSATDLELPGLLPLTVRRAYASGYQSGRLFGPGWSSTLDQRIEIDGSGIHFAGDDAQILHYPIPAHEAEPAVPAEGVCWPLFWDREAGRLRIEDPFSGWTYHFETDRAAAVHPISALTDRNGHRIDYLRDDYGRPVEIAHSGGYRVAVDTVHTSGGPRVQALRLLDATNGVLGTTVLSYGYDALGRLTDIINSSGLPDVYSYDANHRITGWTDRNGFGYSYEYDEAGRVTRSAGSDGALDGTIEYDENARTTRITDSLGHTTTVEYDGSGHPTSLTDPRGAVTRTEHDRYGRLLSRTDPLGHTIRYTRNGRDDIIRVDRPDGTSDHIGYNTLHQPVQIETPDGRVRRRSYDERGNLLLATDPAGAVTEFAYDEAGRLTSFVDALGNSTLVVCNPAGLPVSTTDSTGAGATCVRDAFGLPATTTDPLGSVTGHTWTPEGLPLSQSRPDGSSESWTYDLEGNLLMHTDPVGATTSFEYTRFNMVSARTDPDGTRYTFEYDTELQLVRVTNPLGLTWRYRYDSAGRLSSETDFDDRTLDYGYDAADRLISRTNGLGQTVNWELDPLGDPLSKDAAGEVTGYTYDPVGRLLTATSPNAVLSRDYDQVGRLVAETVNGRTAGFGYDRLGRRTERRTPSGSVSAWSYDSVGNPESLVVDGQALAFAHDAAGRETNRRYGSHLTLSTAWDELHRLSGQTLLCGTASAPLLERGFGYRADGNLVEMTDRRTGTRRFELDAAGRVTAVHAAEWSERYAYDGAGNLTSAEVAPGRSATANGGRSYQGTLLKSAGRSRYEHDAICRTVAGSHTTLSGKVRTWRYTWDAEDRLTQVTTPDGARWRYLYDPLGRRMAKQRLTGDGAGADAAQWTEFCWDGSTLIEQTAHAPTLPGPYTQTWEYRGLQPVVQAERLAHAAADDQDEVDRRFFAVITDLVGAPTHLVDFDGSPAWQGEASLWGVPTAPQSGATSTPLRFPGQYYDPESRLHYNLNRYYDPAGARYLTPDPLGLAPAPNPYTYVANPLTWCDPLGLAAGKPDFTQLPLFVLRDGELSSPADIASSRGGPTARKSVPADIRARMTDKQFTENKALDEARLKAAGHSGEEAQGHYQCWRCGHTSTNPADMQIGHRNVPRANGGNLNPENLAVEGAACNSSAQNRGYVTPGKSCAERGGCGAGFGRYD